MIIGITGGVGCGKSTVCKYIKEITGCLVIDTDSIAKSLMEPGNDCYCDIVSYFSGDILNDDLTINRSKLSKIVFNDKEKLEVLNSFTHERTIEKVKAIIKDNSSKIIIIESALLLETELENLCDYKIFVTASLNNRKERLISGRGYSIERINNMIEKQKNDEFYISKSNFILLNDKLSDMKKSVSEKLIELGLYEINSEE